MDCSRRVKQKKKERRILKKTEKLLEVYLSCN